MTIHRARRLTSIGMISAVWGSLGLWLAGCTSPVGPTTPTAPPRPAVAAVVASEAALAAAGQTILACYSIPACSKVASRATIRANYDTAYTAVTQAQVVADGGSDPDMAASVAAIAALQAVVAQLPK
jgi:hypothetical protein